MGHGRIRLDITRRCILTILIAWYEAGIWRRPLALRAPLFQVEASKLLVELGMPRKKIAVGLPTYGHSFQLIDHTNPVIGAAAVSGEPARYTRTHGFYAYYEVGVA